MTVHWLPEARDDVQRLYDFLVAKNPAAARRAVSTIRDGAEKLNRFPDLGRPMDDDTGRRELMLPFGGGHYVLRYQKSGNNTVVIRVWHGREGR